MLIKLLDRNYYWGQNMLINEMLTIYKIVMKKDKEA